MYYNYVILNIMNENYYQNTITIRMPSIMTNLISAEVAKRNFFNKDGQINVNEFLNKMLPNMLAYREYKKISLRDFLDKKIKACITERMQEKILDFLSESFDYFYFDEGEYACNDVINLRFSVSNEKLYSNLFIRLDNISIKRSTYIRNLINEYLNLSEHQKERICFDEEFIALANAINDSSYVQFLNKGVPITAIPFALEYSVKQEHWYLLYLNETNIDALYSTRLYNISKVLCLRESELSIPKELIEKIKGIIERGEYAESNKINFGDVDYA